MNGGCRFQWGDEGAGKIVDWLSEQADVIVRFQGGTMPATRSSSTASPSLSLLPSGVVRPGKLSVIGNGVALTRARCSARSTSSRGMSVTPRTCASRKTPR